MSTYTANLAAFLTVKKIQPPISSVTDLAEQTKIKFGTVKNSGVESFFKKTNIITFKQVDIACLFKRSNNEMLVVPVVIHSK